MLQILVISDTGLLINQGNDRFELLYQKGNYMYKLRKQSVKTCLDFPTSICQFMF